jgi:hypothetical protein
MASIITVRRWLGPRLRLLKTLSTEAAVEQMTRGSGLTSGDVSHVVYELRDLLIRSALMGQPVRIEGLGTFTPSLTRSGELRLLFRPDPALKRALARKKDVLATVLNARNIGATDEKLAAQWNVLHPEDPVILASSG